MIDLNDVIDELAKLSLQHFQWSAISREFDESTPESYIEEWIRVTRTSMVEKAFEARRAVITEPEVLRVAGAQRIGVRVRALTIPLVGE